MKIAIRPLVLVLGALALVASVACGGSDDDSAEPSATAATDSDTSTSLTPRATKPSDIDYDTPVTAPTAFFPSPTVSAPSAPPPAAAEPTNPPPAAAVPTATVAPPPPPPPRPLRRARQHDAQPGSDRRALLDRQPERARGHSDDQLQQQRRRHLPQRACLRRSQHGTGRERRRDGARRRTGAADAQPRHAAWLATTHTAATCILRRCQASSPSLPEPGGVAPPSPSAHLCHR